MTLASPFVKGGSRGILLSYRLLIFNNNFLIDPISPNPSLLKRGNKKNTFTVSERASSPPTDARHPCRAPVVANLTKLAVLGTANVINCRIA